MQKYWFIVCADKRNLAWSQSAGWVADDNFDLFSDSEKETFALPQGGEWQEADNV